MVCCALLVMMLSLPLWTAFRLRRLMGWSVSSPLAWKLNATEPAERRHERLGFSVRARLIGFKHAFSGVGHVLRYEHTSWLHLSIAVITCLAAVGLQISLADWRWILFSIFVVLTVEALNTCVEAICDLVCSECNELVRIAKDAGAGAVLLCGIGAGVVGLLTFAPYVHALLEPTHAAHFIVGSKN